MFPPFFQANMGKKAGTQEQNRAPKILFTARGSAINPVITHYRTYLPYLTYISLFLYLFLTTTCFKFTPFIKLAPLDNLNSFTQLPPQSPQQDCVDPQDFNVLMADVNENILQGTVSEIVSSGSDQGGSRESGGDR